MHRCIARRQEFMKSAEPDTPVKPARRVIPFRRAHARRGEELAFLPAAHLRSDLLAEQLNVARLRAALAAGDDPLAAFHAARRCRPGTAEHPA